LLVKPLRRLDIPHPYAEIFQVQDLEDNSTSKVLKILKSNVPKLVDLFKQEASFLINLIHPGIPRAEEQFSLTLGNGQELHCLVMERIEGENLEQWLKPNKQISQAQALEWMRQLVTILDHVHQKRFFHRDIKPSNIMHKPDGILVLIDFGTAREVTQTVINGQDVTVVYSDGYTAPEQIQGHAVPQSDFFALGRTFVHLLTGKHPNYFSRDSQTRQLIWRSSASKEVSPKLADLIDDLIAPSVENRPQNTQVILQRIDKIIEPPRPSLGIMVVAGLTGYSQRQHHNPGTPRWCSGCRLQSRW
jgi:serine/threonine protein kinase